MIIILIIIIRRTTTSGNSLDLRKQTYAFTRIQYILNA
jgi:hypothetical protein